MVATKSLNVENSKNDLNSVSSIVGWSAPAQMVEAEEVEVVEDAELVEDANLAEEPDVTDHAMEVEDEKAEAYPGSGLLRPPGCLSSFPLARESTDGVGWPEAAPIQVMVGSSPGDGRKQLYAGSSL